MSRSTLPPRSIPLLLAAIALSPVIALQASGQDAAPPGGSPSSEGDNDIVVLSPFQVNANQDEEYLARESLAGSRLKTDLSDIASQVDVMTPEFLDDLGITDLEDAMRYSLNVDSAADAIDVSSATAGQDLAGNPISGGRTRGLTPSNKSHDFFGTSIPIDSYNSERFTFSSGPNAILFGNANPSGTIDTTFKRAQVNRVRTLVSGRVDSEGGVRGTFDFNQPIIRKKVALRIAGLDAKSNDFRAPAYTKDQRLFTTFTITPNDKLNFRGWYEYGYRFRQPVRNTLFQNRITPWIDAGMPAYNNIAGSTPTTTGIFEPHQLAGTLVYANDQYNAGAHVTPSLLNYDKTAQVQGNSTLRAAPDNIDTSFTDASLYPLDVSIGGNGEQNRTHTWIAGAIAELNPFRNFFIELGVNKEKFKYSWVDYVNFSNSDLRVDVNAFMPDGLTANPYFGRYYVEADPQGGRRQTERDEQRASFSYELDFTKHAGWTKWLGRHRFAFLLNEAKSKSLSQDQSLHIIESPSLGITATAAPAITATARQVLFRNYLADPQHPEIGGSYTFDLPFDPFDPGILPGTDAKVGFVDSPAGATGSVTGSRIDVDSRVFAMQNYLLKDRIVLTWGWRRDAVTNFGVSYPSTDYSGIPGSRMPISEVLKNYGESIWTEGNHETPGTSLRGAVVHPFRWLSLFYNESAADVVPNFQRFDLTGEPSALSDGEGKDYGVAVRLFDGMLSIRYNRFENTSTGALSVSFRGSTPTVNTLGSNQLRRNIFNIERAVLEQIKIQKYGGDEAAFLANEFNGPYGAYQLDTYHDPANTTNPTRFNDYDVLSDLRATGDEVQIIGRPLRNLNLRISFSKSETVETNIGKVWFDFINERLSVWSQYLDTAKIRNSTNANNLLRNYLPAAIQNWNYIRLSNGRPTYRSSKYRMNFTARYSFSEGSLKGAFLGANYRWLSAPSVGFPAVTIDDNPFVVPGVATNAITVSDVNNPIYGRADRTIDVFVGYNRRMFHRKVDCRFQVNVRNLLNEDDPVIQQSTSTGEGAIYTLPQPRAIQFSTTLSF